MFGLILAGKKVVRHFSDTIRDLRHSTHLRFGRIGRWGETQAAVESVFGSIYS